MPSKHLILCCPLLLLLSIFPSIGVFFQWVSSWHQVVKVLELQLQHQSFQWIFRVDFFQDWLVWSPCNPRDSKESSPAPQFSPGQFSHSVVYDSFLPHGLQLTNPPCPSPTPGIYSNSCLLSQRCHPIISSSVIPFSSCLQSFSASGSFLRSQFFSSGGQSIGVSASASFQWISRTDLLLDRLVWSPYSPKDSQESSPTPHSSKTSIIGHPYPTLISYMTTWKAITLTNTFVGKVMSAF